jgi:4-amino-4-deoxy-L-arabinose transferase-like glycosyltransferase
MGQNDSAGESKSFFSSSLKSISTSLKNKSHWLPTGLIMLFAALGTLFYFLVNKKKAEPVANKHPLQPVNSGVIKVDRDQPDLKVDISEPVSKNNGSTTTSSLKNKNEIPPEESSDQSGASQSGEPETVENDSFVTITWPEYKFTTKLGNQLNTWLLSAFSKINSRKTTLYLALPLLALLLAYMAQSIFNVSRGDGIIPNWAWLNTLPVNSQLWLGSIIFLIAMVLWMFTSPTKPAVSEKTTQIKNSITLSTVHKPFRFLLLVVSIIIFAFSLLLYIQYNDTAAVRILWVIGIILFVLSQVLWSGLSKNTQPNAEESPKFRWKHWVILAIILGVAFWLRFYQVDQIPVDIHGDAASFGLQVRDYLLGNEARLFDIGWADIPRIGFMPATLSMWVFGDNTFGLRMTSVIGGLLNVLAIYLIIWRLFNRHRLAAITAGIVAINILHIHFSRIGPGYTDPWLFCLFAIFFLIDGLKGRRSGSLGLAGVLLAFGINMYFPGKVTPEIIAVFLLVTFFIHRPWIKENKKGLVLFVLGFLIAMGPILVYYIANWQAIIERLNVVVISNPQNVRHLTNKYSVASLFDVLVVQTRLTLLMFNYYGDTSSQFGYPHAMFSPLISPLIILGLGAAIRRWKEPGHYLAIIWLGLMVVMGSILTIDSPFWPRMVGIVPIVAFLIALALDQFIELGNEFFHKSIPNLKTGLVVILLFIVGLTSWNQYYAYAQSNGAPMAIIGRYLSNMPLNITACGLFDGPPLLSVRETYFQAWPRTIIDIKTDGPDSDLTACTGSALVWVISPEHKDRLQSIRALWPGGIEQEYAVNDYVITYYLVDVPAPQTAALNIISIPPISSKIIGLIFDGIAFTGVLILLIRLISKWGKRTQAGEVSARLKKMAPPMPVVQINWRAIHLKQAIRKIFIYLKSSWRDFVLIINNWYQDLIKFDLASYTNKQIISIAVAILLPLFVICLAYFGQNIIDQWKAAQPSPFIPWAKDISESQRLEISGGIFLVAAVLWGWITTRKKSSLSYIGMKKQTGSAKGLNPLKNAPVPNSNSANFGRLIRFTGLLCTFSAMLLYLVIGENGLIRWLWLIGLGLFLLSLLGKKGIDKQSSNEESPSFKWYHVLILSGLLGLAFYLRVYRLNDVPLEFSTDMAQVGLSARDYVLGLEQQIFGDGWFYMPRLSFIPYALSLKLIGDNLFGLYFVVVVMGTLNILGTYLFIWRLFDQHRLAILASVIMVISPGHINFSRITSFMDPWFFGFFALFFLIDGLKGRRKRSLALAGILTGFTLVLYPSGRVIIPIIGIILGCAWLFKRQWIMDNRDGFLGMGLGFLVLLGPNLVFMITNWSGYVARANEVIISNPEVIRHLKTVYNVDSFGMIVWEQVKHSVFMFNYYADLSPQSNYPHPMYNSLISPMLILGLGTAIFRWKKPEYLITIGSFTLILVSGGVLTVNAPTWTRLLGIIPFSALIIAFALNEFYVIMERVSWKVLTPFVTLSLILFFFFLGLQDWNTYLHDMKFARPVVYVSRYLASLPTNVSACGITDGVDLNSPETEFLAYPRTAVLISPDIQRFTPESCPGSQIVWVLTPAYTNRLSEIENVWATGIIQEHRWENGELIFTSYLVSSKPNP